MSHATHPCPPLSPAPPPGRTWAPRPLRVAHDDPSGDLRLSRSEAVRLVLALKHLASFVHWSPAAQPYDEAIAEEAEWMAETLGDAAHTAPPTP